MIIIMLLLLTALVILFVSAVKEIRRAQKHTDELIKICEEAVKSLKNGGV